MTLPVSLVFGHVTIATSSMTFYDCGAVSRLNQSSQYVRLQQASNAAVGKQTLSDGGGCFSDVWPASAARGAVTGVLWTSSALTTTAVPARTSSGVRE